MKKNTIAIFFTVLFMAIITTPSIIVAIDDSVDISCFYSMSEEEEKGNETNKNIKLIFSKINLSDLEFALLNIKNNSGYYFKKYPKPHLNLIFPPPELHI